MSDPKSQRIEELEKQLAEQKDINAANLEVIWNWERKASEYEQKIDSLQEQCKTRYEAIEKLNAEKAQLKDVIESLRKEVDDLCATVNILQSEKKEAQEIIADRTKDVQHYDEENKRLKENNEILQKAYDEQEARAVEWCHKCSAAIEKKNQLSALIGEFVRQAVEL